MDGWSGIDRTARDAVSSSAAAERGHSRIAVRARLGGFEVVMMMAMVSARARCGPGKRVGTRAARCGGDVCPWYANRGKV